MADCRAFTDRDAPLLRSSTLLADSDEWNSSSTRVRIYRNGHDHFVVAETSMTGRLHPVLEKTFPSAAGVPGCAILINVDAETVDTVLEAL